MTVMMSLVASAAPVWAAAAWANEPQDWMVKNVPYAWLAVLQCEVTLRGQKAEFEKSADAGYKFGDMGETVTVDATPGIRVLRMDNDVKATGVGTCGKHADAQTLS